MTTSRLFPATNGPATAIAFGGNFISGVSFSLAKVMWFQGYWWWVAASGQSVSPVKCALWSPSNTANQGFGNFLVPGSVVTSGPLQAGQWNYIPLPAPIPLAPGYIGGMTGETLSSSMYVAAVGCNGNFPDTSGFWTGNGITQGALYGYGNAGFTPPYGMPQGCFSSGAGGDPSTQFPGQASGTDNFWVDVQVSDIPPVNWPGEWQLWPNKYDANPNTQVDINVAYVIATEIKLNQPCVAKNIYYVVPNGASVAAGFATAADVWDINTGLAVASIHSPVWVTRDGAVPVIGATGQWVKAPFAPGTVLPAGDYRVSVFNANGALGGWGAKDANSNYFTSGVGQAGLSNGPLSAPNNAGAQPVTNFTPPPATVNGQPCFTDTGSDTFPNKGTGTTPAQVYWVDLGVTTIPSGGFLNVRRGISTSLLGVGGDDE